MTYTCEKCNRKYTDSRDMITSTITTGGGCDHADTTVSHSCECGELLGVDYNWYCGVYND